MSNFNMAFRKTMGHEGGYVNDLDDAGAETYRGISRRFNPGWPGWETIDKYKTFPNFPGNLVSEEQLDGKVKGFYKLMYWDRFWGDEVANISLDVACEMFDNAVNMGVGRSVRFLQEALNVLNRNQLLYLDISVDSDFGRKSMDALEKYVESDPLNILLKVLNTLQGAHYLKYMGKNPAQEKYARGWFSRVSL